MIIYGKNVYSQIQNDPDAIEKIYVLKDLKDVKLLRSIESLGVPYEKCPRSRLDALAKTNHHQGILCSVKEIPTYSLEDLVSKAKTPGLIVALDGIQDPHNFGAILRTCDCTGVDGVLITKHKSVGLTPAAIKSSTGAAYTIPVSIVTNMSNALKTLKDNGYWVVGTDMENAKEYRHVKYDMPTVLVIGSEGKGISPLVKKQCDFMAYLPMAGSITSLNASVACGVLLYEVYNQRNPR